VLAEIALPVQALADECLTVRQIAVRLQPPAVDDHPAALLHQPGDVGEERGIEIFDPAIDSCLTAGEDHPRMVGQQLDRSPAGTERLGTAFRPAPEPGRIQVGVPDHVHAGLGVHASLFLPVCV
jgi:hypothetical protein